MMKGSTLPSSSYLQLRASRSVLVALPIRLPRVPALLLPAEGRVGAGRSELSLSVTLTAELLPPFPAVKTDNLPSRVAHALPLFRRNPIATAATAGARVSARLGGLETWWGSEAWRPGLAHAAAAVLASVRALAAHAFSIAAFSMVASAHVGCSFIIAHSQYVASSVLTWWLRFEVRLRGLLSLAMYNLQNARPELQLALSSGLVCRTLSVVLLQHPHQPVCETRFCQFYYLRHASRLPHVVAGGRPRRSPKVR